MPTSQKGPNLIEQFTISDYLKSSEIIRKVEAGKYFRLEGILYCIEKISHPLNVVVAISITDSNWNLVPDGKRRNFSWEQVVPNLLSTEQVGEIYVWILRNLLRAREERILSGLGPFWNDFGRKNTPYDVHRIGKPEWYWFDDSGELLPRAIDNTSFIKKNFEIPQPLVNNVPDNFPYELKPEIINILDHIPWKKSFPPYQKRPK